MSYFLIDYFETRLKVCDELLADASDQQSRSIYEAARLRFIEELSRLRQEYPDYAKDN
jgi:hypothetical protein